MTPGEAAALLGTLAPKLDNSLPTALKKAGDVVAQECRDAIGTYKYGWPGLGPAAVSKHGDTPLLDTGELQASYRADLVSKNTVEVGSDSPKAEWQENGTSRGIPPRPVVLNAGNAKEAEVVRIIEDAVGKVIDAF